MGIIHVKLIDFSPGEKFLVTYRSHEPSNSCDSHRFVLNIFDVRTGKVMRKFEGSANDIVTGGQSGVSWPVMRWAGGNNDKYFARMGKNVISVYETETFTLIDKKSLKVQNVIDFSWSPIDPIIAFFVPELGGGNQPAKDMLNREMIVDLMCALNMEHCDCSTTEEQTYRGRKNSSVSSGRSKASPYPCSSRSSLQYLPKPLLEDVKEWDQKKPSALCAWSIRITLLSIYVPPRRKASVHSCVTQHSNYVDQFHKSFAENLSIVPLQSRRKYLSGIAQETRRETRRSNLLDARRVEDALSVPISSPTSAM
ncbi:hypothetical protein IFM89_036352 [Coptis chinensis]|uniref:Uncharacterized protein n=1 Tax=Coptis chinensis TaxID=261450 RepID=A0A835HHP2_9MAGN|nr:hypothetical protein IFM89_036352 [Coptis chinensis]